MKFLLAFTFLLVSCCLSAAQANIRASIRGNSSDQAVQPKAINAPLPMAPYPEEAFKNHIEGKVMLNIVVDGSGKVSEAKVLSGPLELQPVALASVKMWQFEPPASAPVSMVVEISYGLDKDCPGPESDRGTVEWSWGLRDKDRRVVAIPENDNATPPRYSNEERKSGVAGNLVLSISLYPDGRVQDVHVVQPLSPVLDKSAIDVVRTMKFRRSDANSTEPLQDLHIQFAFRAMCSPRF